MNIFNITVAPTGNGLYSACLDDRVLCASEREPFLSAARVLQAEGADADAVLVMRHAGSETIALRGRLGILAKLTVSETGRPKFEPYRDRLHSLTDPRHSPADADLAAA